jgi:hypothetical protein
MVSPLGTPSPPLAARSTSGGAAITAEGLELRAPNGQSLRLKIRTTLGKALVRPFGSDAEFWDEVQCVLERNTRQEWIITPNTGTANETLVNGSTISAPQALCQGDAIAVGRQAKGIAKLPLIVGGF